MQPRLFFILLAACAVLAAQGSAHAVSKPSNKSTVVVYRCVDIKNKISLQDSPCAKTSKQETREMLRPKDSPPIKKIATNKPMLNAVAPVPIVVQDNAAFYLPPDLYQCTNYEGKVRDSENYDPNPRCEPLWALGYQQEYLPTHLRGNQCTWIKDSCVRYEGRALCDRWKIKQKQAQSDLRYAFSDTSAYRKSELARITQIVRNSCE